MRRSWQSLMNELRRLNNARLGRNALAKLPRRERSKAVKAALEAHHQTPNRCC